MNPDTILEKNINKGFDISIHYCIYNQKFYFGYSVHTVYCGFSSPCGCSKFNKYFDTKIAGISHAIDEIIAYLLNNNLYTFNRLKQRVVDELKAQFKQPVQLTLF